MNWEFVATLLLAIPIISLPLVVWYSDIGRGYTAIYKVRRGGSGSMQDRPTAGAGQREVTGNRF